MLRHHESVVTHFSKMPSIEGIDELEKRRKLLRPCLDEEKACAICLANYGLTVTSIRELDSYDDRNFRVVGRFEGKDGGETYTLKVHNGTDASDFLDAQDRALRLLRMKGMHVPCPAYKGRHSKVTLPILGEPNCRQEHAVRLLEWVDGAVLSDCKDISLEQLTSCGRLAAQMDVAFQDMDEAGTRRQHIWDLQNMAGVADFMFALQDDSTRANVQAVLDLYHERIRPTLEGHSCRRQVIHSDLNDANMLLATELGESAGILDFGDMVHTYLVNEVSIGMAYAMVGQYAKQNHSRSGLLAAAEAFYRGYIAVLPLTEAEISVCMGLALCRLAMSVTLGAYARSKAPENEYLGLHATPAVTALELLVGASRRRDNSYLDELTAQLC
jgi:hydroxylysine kinase